MERNLAIRLKKLESLNWAPITHAMRERSKYRGQRYREADPSQGDATQVRVFCKQCGFTTVDTTPVFHIFTGAYVVRKGRCYTCQRNPSDISGNRKRSRRSLYPIEPIPFIGWYQL